MRLVTLLLAFLLAGLFTVKADAATYHLYVGTATGQYGRPWIKPGMPMGGMIYLVDFDSETGALSNARVVAYTPANVGWLLVDPKKSVLYAANETAAGSVSAYAIGPNGGLTLINNLPTQGSPVFLSLHQSGKYLVAGNFGGGSVVAYSLKPDGSLDKMTGFFQAPSASGPVPGEPDPARLPQMHSVYFDPTGKFVIGSDHGRNKLFVLALDQATGKLTPADIVPVTTAGDAPRHGAFSPDGKTFYGLSEKEGKVAAYDFAPATGKMTLRQTVLALPDDFKGGGNASAELLISKDGRFLYVSHRGHDSIATLKIGPDGKLTLLGETPSQSPRPRVIAFDPSGRFLVSAVEQGDEVSSFRIDPSSGIATYAKQSLALKDLWSLAFLPPELGR